MTSFTIFGQATNWSQVTDKNPYTLGVQFSVSQSVSLTGIWFHSASGVTVLPTQCVIFNGDTTAQVASTLNTSPSWSGAAGSGWVKCAYGGSVTLVPGVHYVAAVFFNTTTNNWYSDLGAYWTSGAGASGITNGPLSAPQSSAALNGQAVFHAGTTLAFPATTSSGADFGVDVEVTTSSGAGPAVSAPPPLIPPHPLFPETLLAGAYQRADWQAQGVADLTVAFSSTSGGIDTYNVTSPWNGTSTYQMRVLAPTAPNPDFPHAFLIMLPVQQNQDTNLYGDSIGTAQSIAAHNGYNLTCVQPGYAPLPSSAEGPWFADNPLNPAISQEKFTLLVTGWVRQHLAVTGQEQVYLIGFSRSGLGAANLLFRHPYVYAACATWDAPFGMTDYDGTDPIRGSMVGGDSQDGFGTSANFTNHYQMTTARLSGYQGTGQYGINRISLGLGPDFGADVPWFDGQLTANGIPHTYTFSNTVEAHAWQTDWVAAGLQAIIPSNAPTVLPQQIPQPLLTQLLKVAAWRMPGASPAASTSASAAAGQAAGTGTAQGATAAVAVNAGLATGTGAAQGAVPAIAVNAALASGAATAQNATASTSASGTANAVLASGAGTAQSPVAAIGVNAAAATGTGAAQGATVQTSGSANVTAGLATAAGAAQSPATAIAVNAAAATGAGTAQGAGRAATAGLASGTGTAQAAALAVAANAAAANAVAAALGITTAVVTPGTLTATTAATATLTAGDQRTGGPG